ncbi:MAG: hypothetical protein EOO39_40640, partial [Cytophagaceae bacterium]
MKAYSEVSKADMLRYLSANSHMPNQTTIQNLREIAPTAYFNVPKGFEMLIPYLEKEPELRQIFFQNLNMLFYAGAS